MARRVVSSTFVSLDGVMQAPGGPEEDPTGGFRFGGWVFPHWDEAGGKVMSELFAAPFDLLLGRKTYEIFAAYWPYIGDENPIARPFNRATKYVASRSEPQLTWKNSLALRADAAAEVAKLKSEDGPTLLIQGSSVLIHALQAKDLIDEYRVLIFPVLLGAGKKLFGEGTRPAGLKLVRSQVTTTGVVICTYEPAGEVRTGSFAQQKPSDAEIKRREKMKAEATQ